MTEPFWLEDWTTLYRSRSVWPSAAMTQAERLNVMTRLLIVVAVLMVFVPFLGSWWLFLLLGLLLVLAVWFLSKPPPNPRPNPLKPPEAHSELQISDIVQPFVGQIKQSIADAAGQAAKNIGTGLQAAVQKAGGQVGAAVRQPFDRAADKARHFGPRSPKKPAPETPEDSEEDSDG